MVRTEQLEGRTHFVMPTVMILEGVWSGSRGPVFYGRDELEQSVPFWNGKPVVVYHPDMGSQGFASHPEVFNRQKVGTLFNTRFDGKRLLADVWIDVERVKKVDNRVLETIRNQRVMEVSTGLCFAHDNQTGVWNGEGYLMAAKNLQPDHLAILPDKIGACSVAAGAGLIRNLANGETALAMPSLFVAT